MKKPTTCLVLAILFLTALYVRAQTGKEALLGVWKYQLEGMEGISVISPTHAVWLLTAKNRPPFTGQTPAVSEKAKAYESVIAAALTWELESETRAKAFHLYASPVDLKGTYVRWDFERSGDELTYWIIQPDGSRAAPGKCRKIADWNTDAGIQALNGVWEYEDPVKGLYLHSGGYGVWVILNQPQAESKAEEGKAQNFDAINSSAVIGASRGGSRHVWHVLHSADIRGEKQSLFTDSEKTADDRISMWFIDGMGKPSGGKFQVKRIH